jgi:hypothetical protein
MRFVLPMLELVPGALVLEYGRIDGPTAVLISADGGSNWLQAAQLLDLYLMLGISIYHVS